MINNSRIGILAASSALIIPMSASAQATGWADKIELSGVVEVEMSVSENFANQDASDIALSTVELGLDSQVTDNASIHVLLLHEDDGTEPMEVDEASITYKVSDTVSISAGRMYVPFGVYDSNLISDPLTLEIGETREAAIQINLESGGFYGALYTFNGDTIETSTAANGDDTVDHMGLSVGYRAETGDTSFDIGLDYINSIGDSDTLSGTLPDVDADGLPDSLNSYVSGIVAHATVNQGPFNVIFEYLASDQFLATELAFKGVGAEPTAYNIELGYNLNTGGRDATIAVAYQGTDESVNIGLPEQRILIGLSLALDDNTSLGFEIASDEDYASTDGGTGNTASTMTAQLAVEF